MTVKIRIILDILQSTGSSVLAASGEKEIKLSWHFQALLAFIFGHSDITKINRAKFILWVSLKSEEL